MPPPPLKENPLSGHFSSPPSEKEYSSLLGAKYMGPVMVSEVPLLSNRASSPLNHGSEPDPSLNEGYHSYRTPPSLCDLGENLLLHNKKSPLCIVSPFPLSEDRDPLFPTTPFPPDFTYPSLKVHEITLPPELARYTKPFFLFPSSLWSHHKPPPTRRVLSPLFSVGRGP